MAILRNPKKQKFVQIDNALLETPNLSFRSKAILIYLLSRPDGWDVNLKDIQNRSPSDKRAAIRKSIAELEEAGFLRKERVHADGRMRGWEYWISESPSLKSPLQKSEKLTSENQPYSNTGCLSNTGCEAILTPELDPDSVGSLPNTGKLDPCLANSPTPDKPSPPSLPLRSQGKQIPPAVPVQKVNSTVQFRKPPLKFLWQEFMEAECSWYLQHHPDSYEVHVDRGWTDTDGKPIVNWRAYFKTCNDSMLKTRDAAWKNKD